MTVKEAQRALAALGYRPGEPDGIFGPRTRSALLAFQKDAKSELMFAVKETGELDAETVRLLSRAHPTSTATAEPVWLQAARSFVGVKEIHGPASNSKILEWARGLGGWVSGWYRDDDTPWCGLFVGHCISTTLPSEPLPSNPLAAKEWLKFGKPLDHAATGCILVFSRAGGGHVGFCVGEDAQAYHVLGGNQGNSVSIARIAKDRLVGMRWPSSVPVPASQPMTSSTGAACGLSKDEA